MLLINNHLAVYVILLGLLVFFFLTYLEIKKANKKRLYARILASFGAVLALVLLALQPAWQIRQRTQTAILLTKNYSSQTLDSLKKMLKEPLILDYAGFSQKKNIPKVLDLSHLQRNYAQIQKLFILGEGIPIYDLKKLQNIDIQLFTNPLLEGIVALEIPDKISAQSSFEIKGSLLKKTPQTQKIILANAEGNLDSLTIKGEGKQDFRLRALAKNAGNYLYQIITKNTDNQVINQENIPLSIQSGKKSRVWILNSSPSFESKYLKNYLGDAGYAVAVRSLISSGKFKDEFVNQKNISLQIGQDLTEKVDVLLMDSDYWQSLSSGEQSTVNQAITESGLGVLIWASEELSRNNQHSLLRGFNFNPIQQDTLAFSAVEYQGKNKFNLKKLPFRIQSDWATIPLLADNQGNTSVAYRVKGKGKIAVSLLPETYPMTLAGQSKLYEVFWANLLNQLNPQAELNQIWKSESLFNFVDEPSRWTLQTTENQPIGVLKNSENQVEKFYFQQNPSLEQTWQTTFWAKQKGWHTLQIEADSSNAHSFYVFENSAWQSLRLVEQLNANQFWAKNQKAGQNKSNWGDFTHNEPINLFWFYGLFLLCVVFLWVESKL